MCDALVVAAHLLPRCLGALLMLTALSACEDDPPRTPGTRADSGAAQLGDAEPADFGPKDVGRLDAGASDASPAADANPQDAEPSDLGIMDAGLSDAAPADSGPVDTGPAAVCGDGSPEGNEACDDGNTVDGDYCSADCSQVTGRCGDGTLQDNETCDDGQTTTACDTLHDGGDGACLPAGQCSTGYVLDGNGDCIAAQLDSTVIIDVSNTCVMTVTPLELTVPAGQTVYIDWFNRSVDYPVDVWLSYGGGYLDLLPGTTWDEPIPHCGGPNPHTEYADISTACSSQRFYFRCQ